MANKQVRLDDDAIRILKEFQGRSNTLSEAIRNMEIRIKVQQNAVKSAPPDTKVTQFHAGTCIPTQIVSPDMTQHDTPYWKKLSETVDSCIERAKRY
jgi:hypothetical protein